MARKNQVHLKLGMVCVGQRNPICRRVPFSPNKKMHWGATSRWKEAWHEEVWGRYIDWKRENGVALKNFIKQFPLGRAKMDIFIFTTSPQDYDNSVASMKGVIDGVVRAGIIKDDRMDCVIPNVKTIKVSKKTGEHVELIIWKQ